MAAKNQSEENPPSLAETDQAWGQESPTFEATATRYIDQENTLFLWVRAGGRCSRCNRYLLEDEISEKQINLGERAHIVGWKDSSKSPRGDADLPLEDRNKVDNLMLMCMGCHKIIDDQLIRKEFPIERLTQIKLEHEGRIRDLTGISPDRDTAILRVFGSVRGAMPELAREAALDTVVKANQRYAKFPLSPDRQSIELDLSSLSDPETVGDDAYWTIGKSKIDEVSERVRYAIQQNHIRHLSLFALARIPLMVYLGYRLDDKVPVDIYQKHRGEGEGWCWPNDDKQPVTFEIRRLRDGKTFGEVTAILSLSGTINLADVPPELSETAVYEIRPSNQDPNPNLFRSYVTLDAFDRCYRDLLARLETLDEKPRRIHLLPAVPLTAAIACGRSLMRDVHPEVMVYDRINSQFKSTLAINIS